ncbi:hypothetical protein KZP23_09455 [Echinicola marina]|uniref:hypothetical protein n=1 Tax=Echinicola marina TaxID=2859768 RepID=UPI001CF6522D|nr:hypothetical protein [Echinicola marina]UCS95208.1 hypothetical protein KZP23_09455 [Echinicola marina]
MKKMIMIGLVMFSAAGTLQAQNFSEWFRQKKTQKKYLLQQIAALQVYIEYAQKGYRIAREGLTTIGGFTKGEFDLHSDFIHSLSMVNPEIRHYAKVAEIIALQVNIVQDYQRTYRQLRNSDAFSAEELSYIQRVFTRLLDDCEQALDELIAITTDAQLQMEDNERISRIDRIYLQMQDNYTFSQNFGNEAKVMAAVRIKEQNEVQLSRTLMNIQNE